MEQSVARLLVDLLAGGKEGQALQVKGNIKHLVS